MTRALILLVPVLCLGAAELRLLTPEARVGEMVEWELVDAGPAALDVTANPTLNIGTGSAAVSRPAFAYQPWLMADIETNGEHEFAVQGGLSLRIRHSFRMAGDHSLVLTDASGAELLRDTITVAANPDSHGVITVSPHNPRLLAYSDGTPYMPIGCNLAWGTRPDRLATVTRYLDRLAAAGGNHIRLWCASWCGSVEGDQADNYRLEQAWLLDQILDAARARHISVMLVLDNHYDLTHGKAFPYGATGQERAETFINPILSPQYQRRVRYLLARYGANDAIMAWELFNEIDIALRDNLGDFDHSELGTAWAEAAASFINAHDPDHRLTTISLSHSVWTRLFAADAIDLVQVHNYVPTYGVMSPFHHDGVALLEDALMPYGDLGKPIAASEVGHHGTEQVNPGNELDADGALLRHQAWAGLLLGGYGSGMNWWWDVYIDRNDLWAAYTPMAKIVSTINWRDPSLQPLRPNVGSSLRIIGWRSRDQALLWPQSRQDT
ncbi:MAG: cellulase family glycosylhydrolase, partial [Planctomycetota bacterium]|nr:cellulase family glycosylhydrolase [Planctomycetota bacterium]